MQLPRHGLGHQRRFHYCLRAATTVQQPRHGLVLGSAPTATLWRQLPRSSLVTGSSSVALPLLPQGGNCLAEGLSRPWS